MSTSTKKKAAKVETAEQRAMRLLEKQMDLLRDRVVQVESRARNNAKYLPNGDARLYISYVRQLNDRMIAAFEAGGAIPFFGSTVGVDEDDD